MKQLFERDILRIAIVLVLAFVTLYEIRLLAISWNWRLLHDAPLMHYVSWRILHGAIPYKDLFDMNFPGTYACHMAVLAVLGKSDLAWRITDLAFLAAAVGLAAAFCRKAGRLSAVAVVCFFSAYHLRYGAPGMGQRDFLILPFLMGGVYGVTAFLEDPRRRWALFAGALAVGFAATIKPIPAFLAAMLGAWMLWEMRTQSWKSIGAAAAIWCAGFLVAPLAAIGWLASLGVLGTMVDLQADFVGPVYSKINDLPPGRLVSLALPILLVVAFTWPYRLWALGRLDLRRKALLISFFYGLVHFFGQRKGWDYHANPMAYFGILLAMYGLDGERRLPTVARWGSLVGLLAAVFFLVPYYPQATGSSQTVDALAADLRRRLQPGDRVQVVDTTAGAIHALFIDDAVLATRFLYEFPLRENLYPPELTGLCDRYKAEFMAELEAASPRLVVVMEKSWAEVGYDRLDSFPAFVAWLDRGYRTIVDDDAHGFRIYERIGDPESPGS